MKTLVRSIKMICVLMGLIIFSVQVNAQFAANNQNQLLAYNSIVKSSDASTIKDINVALYDGIVYVKLIIKGLNADCIFALQRSSDGITFETIELKNGLHAANSSTEIMYCLKDTDPMEKTSYYRVKQILSNDEKYTDALMIYNKPSADFSPLDGTAILISAPVSSKDIDTP